MIIQESAEMYMETIYVLSKQLDNVRAIDIAKKMNFSKPSVSRAMKNLSNEGYLNIDDNQYITLTKKGLEIAKKIYERHELLTNIFISIGVDPKIAEDDAMVELEADAVEEEKKVVSVQVPVPVQSLSFQKNELIQKILSEKGVDNEKVNQVASIVSKHIEEKNHKQVIYRAITSKFGQQEGLDLYTLIKKSL